MAFNFSLESQGQDVDQDFYCWPISNNFTAMQRPIF